MDITSTQNPQLKEVLRLRERKERDASGQFLIEGHRELQLALKGGVAFQRLFYCEAFFQDGSIWSLVKHLQTSGVQTLSCSQSAFEKISYRDRPDGVLGVARQMHRTLADLPRPSSPIYVVAEAIEKPGNLGTILRSSDAIGVTGVVICDQCTDIFNPNVVRASTGTLFTQPVVEATSDETLQWLKASGTRLIAATPVAQTVYFDADLTGSIAIAFGTEQLGLSPRFLAAADLQVKIPMLGSADSLNVAMATSVLLYEALRQRTRPR